MAAERERPEFSRRQVVAIATGRTTPAKLLALSANLDGVEPVEPTLAARDSALMREIETASHTLLELLNELVGIKS